VPPPPVAGAAVSNGLADWRGVADAAAEGRALALGVVTLAVLLGSLAGVVEPAPAGENGVGVAEGEDPVQAETDEEASMVKVAQPATVSLALRLVPMLVVRIFMSLLMPPAGGGQVFPVPVSEGKSRASQQGPGSADGHKGKAHGRRRHAMAGSSLEY
jgi:hypothetical protein